MSRYLPSLILAGLVASLSCGTEIARDPQSRCDNAAQASWFNKGYEVYHTLPSRCPVGVVSGVATFVEYEALVEGPAYETSQLSTDFTNRLQQFMVRHEAPFRKISLSRDRADLFGSYPAGTGGTAINPSYPMQDLAQNFAIRYDATSPWAVVYLTYTEALYALYGPANAGEGEPFTLNVGNTPPGSKFLWIVDGLKQSKFPTEAGYLSAYGGPPGTSRNYQVDVFDAAGEFKGYVQRTVTFTDSGGACGDLPPGWECQ